MWPFTRRGRRRPPPGPPHGNGREQAARAALRVERAATKSTDELTLRGELLAEHVRRALGGFR